MSQIHKHPIRVYYEDTDAQAIVYHANYLKFMERARTEMMRQAGLTNSDLIASDSAFFVLRHLDIHYLASAKLDDELIVETHIEQIGNASITLQQNIMRNGQQVVASRVVLVCINPDGKPVRVPLAARQIFAAYDHSTPNS